MTIPITDAPDTAIRDIAPAINFEDERVVCIRCTCPIILNNRIIDNLECASAVDHDAEFTCRGDIHDPCCVIDEEIAFDIRPCFVLDDGVPFEAVIVRFMESYANSIG